MFDPVKTLDGMIYEKAAISEWFKNNNTSPLTNLYLENKTLKPDHELRKEIIKNIIDKKFSEVDTENYFERCESIFIIYNGYFWRDKPNIETVLKFIEKGAAVNILNENGYTPLIFAISNSNDLQVIVRVYKE